MEIQGLSDKGLQRENNEDSFYINQKMKVAIVADGMGGRLGGEVASEMCTSMLSIAIEKNRTSITDPDTLAEFLVSSFIEVNKAIYDRSKSEISLKGMGSTVSLLMNVDKEMLIINIGDSRIYRLRDKALTQLTKDDSLVNELFEKGEITKEILRTHPLKNVITKSMGTNPVIPVESQRVDILPGDYYILCSDGLTDMLMDYEICEIVIDGRKPRKICKKLIKKANECGGRDNITVVCWKY